MLRWQLRMTRTAFGAAAALATLLGAPARAGMPATAPYLTDTANLYVQDDTSQGISSLNMVLCVIGSMDPGDMVNTGPYLALVDMNKCQNKGGSNAAGAGATNYANAIVDVTRATNNDPMVAKVWLSMTEQGNAVNVYAYLTATQSPSQTSPYGVFRMDYIGKKNGQTAFNGYIDSRPSVISYYETGAQSNGTALAMSATSTSAGSGTMSIGSSGANFNFAYDANYFHRSDGTNDVCFDRSKANAKVSVWQYGTYDASTGARVDQANPGFPIQALYNGVTYYGFANYWGINFQGLDIPDGQPVAGLTVTDQRPGNSTTYNLSKIGGKLTQWTRQSTTLGALERIPFNVGADLTGLTSGNVAVTGWNNWVLQWNATGANFTVVGIQNCGNNGCVVTPVNPAATVNANAFNSIAISGWADSYGGSIEIPPTGSPHVYTDAVHYYTQSTVAPGSMPLNLYCLSQCPTALQLQAFSALNAPAQTTPFGNGTDTQWFSGANTVSYTFDAGGLKEGGTPMVVELASQYPSGSSFAQNGIQTGHLFTSPLTGGGSCPGSVCEPTAPQVYYTWQTGTQQWNQSIWLTNGGVVVPFDPPLNIAYAVPAGTAYGSYAGLPILLQFNGFGNLFGIPGDCVSPVDNSPVSCATQNARYVPLFSIPDGATMTLPTTPPTALVVKALNGEIRLSTTLSSNCTALSLTPLTVPAGGTHDPSNASDSEYIGVAPTVTSAPKVIDGVVQP
jgi:hypothetical protein